MKTRGTLLIALAAGGVVSALAWQAGLATLGVSQADFEAAVRQETRYFERDVDPARLSPGLRKAMKGLSEAQRAAVVRDLGAAAKALVMSAPFQKAHADHIQSTYKAVNHGIQVKSMEQLAADAAGGRNMEAAYSSMMKQAAVGMVKGLRSMPIDSAKQAFEEDLKSWTRQAASKSSSRALWQKLAARAKEIAPLASSQPEEFKKEYSLLKSLEMGGPGTEAELFSIANSAQHQQQQLAWNQFNLKDLVKRNLTAFVATAATVDFTAKTAQVGTQTKFVNPAYEKKSNLWKALFRAGQAPVAAAVDLAKAWLKELG